MLSIDTTIFSGEEPYLHNGGIICRSNKVPWVAPDQLAESLFVALLHCSPELCGQILRTRTLEFISLLHIQSCTKERELPLQYNMDDWNL